MRGKSYRIFSVINLIFLVFVIIVACSGCRYKEREAEGEPGVGKSAEQEVNVSVKEEEEEEQKEEKRERKEEEMAEITYISPDEVYKIISSNQKSDYIILDVRTASEFKEEHIEGAVLIPVSELEGKLDELPKDKPIIVYCRSGSRSRRAADILVKNGFTHVYDMGGIGGWINSGYPVLSDK